MQSASRAKVRSSLHEDLHGVGRLQLLDQLLCQRRDRWLRVLDIGLASGKSKVKRRYGKVGVSKCACLLFAYS
jgi:hypothetical protein